MESIRRFIFLVSGFWFLVSGFSSYAQQEETLTISTYYPTPYGAYQVLTLYPQSDISLDGNCDKLNEGELVYYKDINPNKRQVLVCRQTASNAYQWKGLVPGGGGSEGFWRQENNNLYPAQSSYGLALQSPISYFKGKLHLMISPGIGGIFRQGDSFLRRSAGHNLGINSIISDGWSGIYGGENNQASAFASIVAGGQNNLIGSTEEAAFIGGGNGNSIGDMVYVASQSSLVSNVIWGGQDNTIINFSSFFNTDTPHSVISGGMNNRVEGRFAVVSGGEGNTASLEGLASGWSVVSGGQDNHALADYSTVTGGRNNLAEGAYSLVSAGEANHARGDYSWVGGRNMQLTPAADRTFAWGHSATPHPIADNDAFIIYSDATTFRVQIGNSPQVLSGRTTDLRIYNLPQPGIPGDNLKYVSSPIDPNAGSIFWEPSSIRYKTNLRPIDNALAKVKQLRGVYFTWKESGKPALGMIAEEVGKVIPEVVSYEENGQDARSLDYDKLVGLLVEAIKEQEERIAELRKGVEVIKLNNK